MRNEGDQRTAIWLGFAEPMARWCPDFRARSNFLILSAVARTLFLAGFISKDLFGSADSGDEAADCVILDCMARLTPN